MLRVRGREHPCRYSEGIGQTLPSSCERGGPWGVLLGSARLHDSAEGHGGCGEGDERDQSDQADVPELSNEIR